LRVHQEPKIAKKSRFWYDAEMDENQRQILLKTAKQAVHAAVRGYQRPPAVSARDPHLLAHRGCFVTLKNGQELRGCIGQFDPDRPLIEMVSRMAVSSAAQDPRFAGDRITPAELPQLYLEISVLSPMEKTDNPLELQLGVHGIYITDGYRSGCFLPQVATETGWTKEEFLDYCCVHKAGLRPGAWRKDPSVRVFLFTAEVFGAAWEQIEV
jgi:AmmeMemoRadiSam system protein A